MAEPNPNARTPQVFDLAFLTDVPNITEVLLIRHGQQEANFQGPVGETVDPPLSERGLMQAELLGRWLSTRHIDAVYASNLRRARQTAEAVAKQQGHHNKEVVVVEDLREVEIFREVPAEMTVREFLGPERMEGMRRRMLVEKSWDVYPYSESSLEFRRRTINAIEGIISCHESERIAIVCHGGVINSYVGHIINSSFDMFFRPAHTSVSIVAAGLDRRALHLLNDVRHLEEGEWLSH